MKRIISLALILSGLAFYAYQTEELGGIAKKESDLKKHKMIDSENLGDMKKIMTSSFEINREGEHFITKNGELVDSFRLQKFLDILGSMRVRRYLGIEDYSAAKREYFFDKDALTLTFEFENGVILFRLGRKLDFDQSFYMEVTQDGLTKQVVAFDSSPNEGTYAKANFHKNPEKYLRFKTMLSLKDNFFIDTHLFQKEFRSKQIAWKSLSLSNLRNKAFSIDLVAQTTTPKAPAGMKVLNSAINAYLQELINFSGQSWLSGGELEDEVANLTVSRQDGSLSHIKIFKKYNTQPGSYIHLIEEDKILSINPKSISLFFKNVENFWDLRAIPTKRPKAMRLSFPEEKEIDVEFKYAKAFKAMAVSKIKGEAINAAFKKLVGLFSVEADQISSFDQGTELERSAFVVNWDGNKMIEGREFHVIIKEREVILANKKLGYKLHYHLDNLSGIGTKLKDFFLK
jgi:hypothetical protein